jgi:mutator protein MutT
LIHVVAAAVTAADGRVLIAQRPPGKHLAGGWEFPGGKLEPGECRTDGLARELHEELGIVIRRPRPLIRVHHSYSYGDVLIDMWVVTCYEGEPRGLDGQALRWLTQDELAKAELLPADRPIVRALRLPARLTRSVTHHYRVIDPPLGCGPPGDRLCGVRCDGVDQGLIAAHNGADFLVIRSVLSDREIAALCEAVAVPVFVRAVAPESAFALGATGSNEIVTPSVT